MKRVRSVHAPVLMPTGVTLVLVACDVTGPTVTGDEVTVPGLLSSLGSEPEVTIPGTARVGEDVPVRITTRPHVRSRPRAVIRRPERVRVMVWPHAAGVRVVEIRPFDVGTLLAEDEDVIWPDPEAVIEHTASVRASAPGIMRIRVLGVHQPRSGRFEPFAAERTVVAEP